MIGKRESKTGGDYGIRSTEYTYGEVGYEMVTYVGVLLKSHTLASSSSDLETAITRGRLLLSDDVGPSRCLE